MTQFHTMFIYFIYLFYSFMYLFLFIKHNKNTVFTSMVKIFRIPDTSSTLTGDGHDAVLVLGPKLEYLTLLP